MEFTRDGIQLFRNFINEEDLGVITEYLNQFNPDSQKFTYYADYMGQEHDHNEAIKIDDPKVIETMRKVNTDIVANNKVYFNSLGLDPVEKVWDRGLELIRWSTCDGLGPHADGSSDTPEYPKYLLAALLYLNDEYDGGEIAFPDYDITIKPKTGDLVYFPSHFIHEVLPILEGNNVRRYTMPVFYTYYIKEKE